MTESNRTEEEHTLRIRRSWFWAGFWDGLALGALWRYVFGIHAFPGPEQCSALSRRKNYCQKAQGHCGAHIGPVGEEWL